MSTAPQPKRPPSFGERLRRERELRGIKLEEIAESTKISKRNLEALEMEHFGQLPGGIFNKGFVRAYAKFLGIDEEQAVNDFLAASALSDLPSSGPPATSMVRPPAMPSEATTARKQRLSVLVAALLLVTGLALWFVYGHQISARWRSPQPAPPAEESSASLSGPAPSTQAAAPGSAPASAAQGSMAAPSINPAASAGSTSSSAPGALVVQLSAKSQAWVSYAADGASPTETVLRAGQSITLNAAQRLVLKTGNAGGLSVTLNGKPLPALGNENEVKTVTLTAAGAQ